MARAMCRQSRLDELTARHRVPGAVLGVLRAGTVETAATGILNVETGVSATPDSLFQIGSITKVYTATLALQLTDEGALDIDFPIAAVLPELELGEPHAAARVTMRHLLTHTSGIEGDHFIDVGRGDDVLERYVRTCAGLGFSHPVGTTFSYCNTGYVIAGRAIEVLTGMTWDAALRERLLDPLGLHATVTLPEEVLRFRAAHGHTVGPDKPIKLAPAPMLPRSTGPAGLIWATAADTLAFARAHLEGTDVLSPASAAMMQAPQVELPDRWTLGSHWGLGWILYDWDGRRVYGHDGATLGQAAFLRVVPDAGVAVVLLTNGGNAHDLYEDLFRELLAELCGLSMPAPLAPEAKPPRVPVAELTGLYERVGVRIELADRGGRLAGRVIATGPLAELDDDPVEELAFVPVAPNVFVTRSDGEQTWTPAVFFALDDGSRYVHMGGRATPRIRGDAP
ncbi:MAG: serine hydrolase domain-containing protein [Umezawaea sp.]